MNTQPDFLSESDDVLRASVPTGLENAEPKDIIDYLFSNNNRLLTATGARMELPHDTQSIIA